MDRPLTRRKAMTLCTEARNFSFGVSFCHVTVLRVGGALDLFEGRRRAETGERASLSGSGVRDRPSESVKLFSRGIVVGRVCRWSCQRPRGDTVGPFCRVPVPETVIMK